MAAKAVLKAIARPGVGKGAARAARRSGKVPGVIYGDKKPPLSISLDFTDVSKRLKAGHFLTTLIDVELDGANHQVIPRGFQLDPLKDTLTHVDFQRVAPGSKLRVAIPMKFVNQEESPGIKRGGTLNIVRHTVEFVCPVEKIPEFITADLTGLEIGKSLHISAVKLPEGIKPVINRDFTVATIVSSSGYLEEQALAKQKAEEAALAAATAVPGAEGAEGAAAPAAGAAPAEGAAAPAAGAAAPAADAKAADKGKK